MPTLKPTPQGLHPVDLSLETKHELPPADLSLETFPEIAVLDEDGRLIGGPNGVEEE